LILKEVTSVSIFINLIRRFLVWEEISINVTQGLKVAQSNTISRLDSAHQSIVNYRI